MKICFSLSGDYNKSADVVLFFKPPKKKPQVPYCVISDSVEFGNIRYAQKSPPLKTKEFLRRLLFVSFRNEARLFLSPKSFTKRFVVLEERHEEERFYLIKFLTLSPERFSFYSAFFFLLLIRNHTLALDPYADVELDIFPNYSISLQVWEALGAPFAVRCLFLDERSEFDETRALPLINNLIGHIMTDKRLFYSFNNFRENLRARFLLSPEPHLPHSHGRLSPYARKFRKPGKGVYPF